MKEYKILLRHPISITETYLNTLSKGGWNLIAIVKFADKYYYYFNKEIIKKNLGEQDDSK